MEAAVSAVPLAIVARIPFAIVDEFRKRILLTQIVFAALFALLVRNETPLVAFVARFAFLGSMLLEILRARSFVAPAVSKLENIKPAIVPARARDVRRSAAILAIHVRWTPVVAFIHTALILADAR